MLSSVTGICILLQSVLSIHLLTAYYPIYLRHGASSIKLMKTKVRRVRFVTREDRSHL